MIHFRDPPWTDTIESVMGFDHQTQTNAID